MQVWTNIAKSLSIIGGHGASCIPSPTSPIPTPIDRTCLLSLKPQVRAENTKIHKRKGFSEAKMRFHFLVLGANLYCSWLFIKGTLRTTSHSVLEYNVFPASPQQQLPSLQEKNSLTLSFETQTPACSIKHCSVFNKIVCNEYCT